jgi:hypothetical protein
LWKVCRQLGLHPSNHSGSLGDQRVEGGLGVAQSKPFLDYPARSVAADPGE